MMGSSNKTILIVGGIGSICLLAGLILAILTLRLHVSPNVNPKLTPAHLQAVQKEFSVQKTGFKVLFIGNSGLINNDVPGLVSELARRDGVILNNAVAAAYGARLVETSHLPEVRRLLQDIDWDVVVLQEFSKTVLRPFDRWGSAWAIYNFSQWAFPAQVLILPPTSSAPGSQIYRKGNWLEAVPNGPKDLAERNRLFFHSLATTPNVHTVNVSEPWLAAIEQGEALYSSDGHHASLKGSTLKANILWRQISPLLHKSMK